VALRRWLALCGSVGVVLVALAFTVVSGKTPNDKASAAKVVSFYRDHATANKIGALMVIIGAVLLVLFAARLREALRGDRLADGVLAVAAFGGGVVLASGLAFSASVHFALVAAADHRFAAPAQTLNVLDGNDFFAIIAGIAIVMLAAGISTVRRPVLPRWLGWVAIVAGILSLAGPIGFAGFLLGSLWILVVGILLATRRLVTVGAIEAAAVNEIVVEPHA
jgi:hypothetical protein